jgi:hypothetical protein
MFTGGLWQALALILAFSRFLFLTVACGVEVASEPSGHIDATAGIRALAVSARISRPMYTRPPQRVKVADSSGVPRNFFSWGGGFNKFS